ncbi:MAG: HDIG domain-containing protein [Spirochaetaceae bacterium]|jgi:putative nucleotidyltransferase with HDIG domain|nr:HDIG domain-containing protein [Spirochaetaceae bacterium]
MAVKKNGNILVRVSSGIRVFFNFLKLPELRTGPVLASAAVFFVSLGLIIAGKGYAGLGVGDIGDFEVGRVAERDVIADRSVSYTDQEATKRRIADRERMIPAVFIRSNTATEMAWDAYNHFLTLARRIFSEEAPVTAFISAVEQEFPEYFSREAIQTLFEDSEREQILEYGAGVLNHFLEIGIVALPDTGLEALNPDVLELHSARGVQTEQEYIQYNHIITRENVEEAIDRYVADPSFPLSFVRIGPAMIKPFIVENIFFSFEETQRHIEEVQNAIEPVVKLIERGKRVIRKGFIVTEDDMVQLQALSTVIRERDPRSIIGQILLLLLLFCGFVFLESRRIQGKRLAPAEVYLVCGLVLVYIAGAVFFRNLSITQELPVALFMPSALVVMLPAILIGPRPAAFMAMILPLIVFLAGVYDTSSYMFAFTSGVVAAYTMQGAEKRMDLIKTGFIIGVVNCIVSVATLLIHRNPIGDYPLVLFVSVVNGIVSGMLVLGFLPMLENALNAVTSFRLIELSDLNAPILKRLFSVAPGTYSHSLMVANLAEAACQEIGANPLLARVGAYYHDIGKMEQPGYFVENQSTYNKHNDISPRLSATVIRSHVKLGAEKARAMGLPRAVVDIILEHHGNSVITWFYNAALKRESQVNKEDFSYPGTPPRSRESAVVMLADVTEAAVRTLKKPTVTRLEKFIQELIMAKFENNQLSESELTFRDLEIIKKAFVRVLAGYYHSRIEYPKLPKPGASPGSLSPGDGVPDSRYSGEPKAPVEDRAGGDGHP